MNTIQCAHPRHHHNCFVVASRLWTAGGGVHALLVLEPTECSTSTRLGAKKSINNLTLAMCELCHWLSIADMLPQSHCGDEEDGCIGFSS